MKDSFNIKKYIFFSFITLLVVFINCSDRNLEPLEGSINFSIAEGYKDHDEIENPQIMLSMVTEKIYPYFNYSIESSVTIKDHKISIELFGIYLPGDIALPAMGPARASSFLDIPEGEYQLYFYYRNTKDKYILIVTDSFIKTNEDVSQFTNPVFNLYWRYPNNSFVCYCHLDTENLWIYFDFVDTMLSQIYLREYQFSDSGEIPYPRSRSELHFSQLARYFTYEKDEDFEKAGEILKSYTLNVLIHYPGSSISLINWQNKKYYSWLFEAKGVK